MSRLKKSSAAVAAVAALGIGGSALADAATTRSKSSSTADRPGAGETALTGDTAAKVQAAALAKVDGTVLRVETDRDGIYEAHIRKADGSEVEVKVDKSFTVTSVESHTHP
jgi:uncharacterized membrane protein YkoI